MGRPSEAPEEKGWPGAAVVRQGISYLAVGGASALIELGVFQLLFAGLRWHAAAANVVAVVVATAFNFILNGRITFGGVQDKGRSLVRYLMLFAFNTVFTSVAITLLVEAGVSGLGAKVATMVCVVLWNFILYRKFVFV